MVWSWAQRLEQRRKSPKLKFLNPMTSYKAIICQDYYWNRRLYLSISSLIRSRGTNPFEEDPRWPNVSNMYRKVWKQHLEVDLLSDYWQQRWIGYVGLIMTYTGSYGMWRPRTFSWSSLTSTNSVPSMIDYTLYMVIKGHTTHENLPSTDTRKSGAVSLPPVASPGDWFLHLRLSSTTCTSSWRLFMAASGTATNARPNEPPRLSQHCGCDPIEMQHLSGVISDRRPMENDDAFGSWHTQEPNVPVLVAYFPCRYHGLSCGRVANNPRE